MKVSTTTMSMGKKMKELLTLLKKPLLVIKKTKFGRGCIIEKNVFFHNVQIGRYCYVGPNSSYNDVRIGNYCSLSIGVHVGGMEHS